MFSRLRLLIIAVSAQAVAGVALANVGADRLRMLYPENAPFIMPSDNKGEANGPIATWIDTITDIAGLPIWWEGPLPRYRILEAMNAGEQACMANALITEDRQAIYKFTKPLFEAPEWRLIARTSSKAAQAQNISDLITDVSLTFGGLLHASLGPELDRRLAEGQPNIRMFRGTPVDLMRMIALGRVDYTIADGREVEAVITAAGLDRSDFAVLEVPGLPRTQAGAIMCSHTVSQEVIDLINAAIDAASM